MDSVLVQAVGRISPTQAFLVLVMIPGSVGLFALLKWIAEVRGWAKSPQDRASEDLTKRSRVLLDQMQRELDRSRSLADRYAEELDQLRIARLRLYGQYQDVRDAAIAARAMVHDMQRAQGVGRTDFPPLPGEAEPAVPASTSIADHLRLA
jgi:hypothetical protein